MNCLHNLGWSPSESVDFGRNENGSSTQAIWPSSESHPGSVHGLNKSDSCVFDLLHLVSELQFAAEPIDEQTWVDDWDIYFFDHDLAAEQLEHLCNFEHVDLDRIREINQQVRALLDSTRHIKTGCGHNLSVSALGQAFEILLVLCVRGYFVIIVAHVSYAFVDV